MSSSLVSNPSLMAIKTFFGLAPRTKPKSIPFPFPFAAQANYTLDLTEAEQTKDFEFIEALYIDNSANAAPATFTFSGTNQTISCPSNSQGYFPACAPKNAKITGSCTGGSDVLVQILNHPVPAAVWKVV